MGSFRLPVSFLHLHKNFNFTEIILETAEQSFYHSCASELTRQGISLPLDRQKYSRRLLKFILDANTSFFRLRSTGQISNPIHFFTN